MAFKKGDFIRWKAVRVFKSIDTYGVVQSVNEENGSIKILTYDDLETTTLSLKGEAIKEEITKSEQIEVVYYSSNLVKSRNKRIKEIDKEKYDIQEKCFKLRDQMVKDGAL